jgi:hypothetical protein
MHLLALACAHWHHPSCRYRPTGQPAKWLNLTVYEPRVTSVRQVLNRMAVVLMSLVRSGRGLGKAPHAYLHDVLNRVGTHPASPDDDLSPDRRMLPGR